MLLIELLAAFVLLHDPQGLPVWVSPSQILAVRNPVNCVPQAKSQITMSSGPALCLMETPAEVLTKLGDRY